MPRLVIHRRLLTALIPTLAVLANAQGAPATSTAPAASIKVESAGDTLPFTLQGFFGKPGAVEVSFRDKTSGATAWVKPGKSFSGWTVESVDTAKGAVVLVADGRHVRLEKAKETLVSEAFAAPKLKTVEESFVWRKFEAVKKDPGVVKFFEEVESRMKSSHPEFYDENGNFRRPEPTAYRLAKISEMKGLLREDKTPSVVNAAPVLESLLDGYIQAGPNPQFQYGGGDAATARYIEEYKKHELRAYEAADRIHLARYGKTETESAPSKPASNVPALSSE